MADFEYLSYLIIPTSWFSPARQKDSYSNTESVTMAKSPSKPLLSSISELLAMFDYSFLLSSDFIKSKIVYIKNNCDQKGMIIYLVHLHESQ